MSGFVDLFFGCGRGVAAGLPSFSCLLRSGLSAGGQGVAGSGGLYPMVLCHSASQCFDQGQWAGRCRIGSALRAGQAGGHVDDPAAQRGAACAGVLAAGEDAGGAQQVVGDRRAQDPGGVGAEQPRRYLQPVVACCVDLR